MTLEHADIDDISLFDQFCMNSVEKLAISALHKRNLPIGCVIAIDGHIIATGENEIFHPIQNPWHHAECQAIRNIPHDLLDKTRDMTLYTSLEPCIMCLSTIILHGIGRVIYGAHDTKGGGLCILPHLPEFYHHHNTPTVIGPYSPVRFDKYYQLAARMFE